MNASNNESTTIKATVSNTSAIRTLNCEVCGQPVITAQFAENVTCKVCGHSMIVRLKPNKDNYVTGLGVTESGNDTVDINDPTAICFRGLSADEVISLGASILEQMPSKFCFSKKMSKNFQAFDGNIEEFFTAKYEDLNVGMQRMNVGNVVRNALKRQSAEA